MIADFVEVVRAGEREESIDGKNVPFLTPFVIPANIKQHLEQTAKVSGGCIQLKQAWSVF